MKEQSQLVSIQQMDLGELFAQRSYVTSYSAKLNPVLECSATFRITEFLLDDKKKL